MPYYGGPDLNITYTYVAVRPFTAEHPIGSGIMVSYAPGDTFPGEDWGNAAFNLVEAGKAVRLAKNIGDVTLGTVFPDSEPAYVPEPDGAVGEPGYPVKGGGGWWTLSDGSRVRGEQDAYEAQAALAL